MSTIAIQIVSKYEQSNGEIGYSRSLGKNPHFRGAYLRDEARAQATHVTIEGPKTSATSETFHFRDGSAIRDHFNRVETLP